MTTNFKARVTMLIIGISALVLHTGVSEAQNAKSQQTWQGFVTDTHCGTNCQVTKAMAPDKKCVQRCVREGSKYGLWVGHRVYTLEPQKKAAQYAARDVTISGTLDGETIHIGSIEPSKRDATGKSKGK